MSSHKAGTSQSTISSFFKAKTFPERPIASGTKRSRAIDLTQSDPDDETNPPPPKRAHSSNRRTFETLGERNKRVNSVTRPRTGHSSSSVVIPPPMKPPPSSTETSRTLDAQRKWSYGSKFKGPSPTHEEAAAKQARRAAFSAKLDDRILRRDQKLRNLEESNEPPVLLEDELVASGSEDDDHAPPTKSKGKRGIKDPPSGSSKKKTRAEPELGPSGQTWTPLEKQVLALKQEFPDVLLMVEVGYKYKFYGEDARIAAKELGIACFPARNFLTASIPTHVQSSRIKKLVASGYKVGVVGQAETAALKKVSDNRSGPFERKLRCLYTAATFVDEDDSVSDTGQSAPTASNAIMCITEQLQGGMSADERVLIGLVSVVPATGDIVYDEFQDSHMRSELETRMTHIRPCELLLVGKISEATQKMLNHVVNVPQSSDVRANTRVEKITATTNYSTAFDELVQFYNSEDRKGIVQASEAFSNGKLVAAIVNMPKQAVVALSHTVQYLSRFGLDDIFVQTSFFSRFSDRAHMVLNGNTLSNLEIYQNQTDGSEKGSLLWILDRTKTRFGARLLKKWIGAPLVDKRLLQERIDAVEEIINQESYPLNQLRVLIKGLPDLVKGLCKIQYGKCRPKELVVMLKAYKQIAELKELAISTSANGQFRSRLLNNIVQCLPSVAEPVQLLLGALKIDKANQNDKADLWQDDDKFPALNKIKMGLSNIDGDFEQELKKIRKILKLPSLKYVAVNHDEYMVEISNDLTKEVPVDWTRISSTKKVTRWHTPTVKRLLKGRDQLKESLAAEADQAFNGFLKEVATHYAVFRNVTNKLAIFDCLNSLATVATDNGYTKPEFSDDNILEIKGGRHPMTEALRSSPVVPNDISVGGKSPSHLIMTGPNMGGKSSCVRMTALVLIMAQIGSYVPADKAHLGLHDAVLTRMGASDELARGRSTFMVEISETSNILKIATPRSLVILDELGRGTSTFDGMSIAFAVFQYLVEEAKCKTMFITHYPILAIEMGKFEGVSNGHMGYVDEDRPDGTKTIDFMYKLMPGIAEGSFGIECARLAGLESQILSSARAKALEMKAAVERRQAARRAAKILGGLQRSLVNGETTPFMNILRTT